MFFPCYPLPQPVFMKIALPLTRTFFSGSSCNCCARCVFDPVPSAFYNVFFCNPAPLRQWADDATLGRASAECSKRMNPSKGIAATTTRLMGASMDAHKRRQFLRNVFVVRQGEGTKAKRVAACLECARKNAIS